jgi:hypothetical protein
VGILIHDEPLGRAEIPHGHEEEIPEDHADVGESQQFVANVIKGFEVEELLVQLSLDRIRGLIRFFSRHGRSSGRQEG